MKHLSELPDIQVSMRDVKVILGQDAYHLIRPLEYKSGDKQQTWAVKTTLGWTASGALEKNETSHLTVSCHMSMTADPLADQLRKWWDMETYSSVCNVTGKSKEEERALSILEKSTKHNGERYEVGLLWADDEPILPNNYYSAHQQFMSLEKRLGNDPELKEAYKATIEKDLENKFVRILDKDEVQETEEDMQWYLPHHPVKHPHKPGKVRRVCNAASKFKGVSLNDKLLSGPDLLRNLVGIIFRFREHEIAITADIESMFLQVTVPKEECKVFVFFGVIELMMRLKSMSTRDMFSEPRVRLHAQIMDFNKPVETIKRNFLKQLLPLTEASIWMIWCKVLIHLRKQLNSINNW